MVRIIIRKVKPEYIRTILLPAQGKLKDLYPEGGEFTACLIYQNRFIYSVEITVEEKDCLLDFVPIQMIRKGKAHYLSDLDISQKKEAINSMESLRNAFIAHCKENNLDYTIFQKYDSYDKYVSNLTEIIKKLIKMEVLNDDALRRISRIADDSYNINVFYSPVRKSFYSSPNLVYSLVKDITVCKDYYEFFVDLGCKPMEAGYKSLIEAMLRLAGVPKKDYSLKWEGAFDCKNLDESPQVTLSHGPITTRFKLKHKGESVDTENLLKGLNAFIKSRFPDEKRKFQELQIFNDQTGCVWFVTEEQLKQLCPIVHAGWEDFQDHCCEITRAETLRKKGRGAVLQLCKKSVEREWKRLCNQKWRVYSAKNKAGKD